MELSPLERRAENPMAAWDRVQRMSEPWFVSKAVVVVFGLIFAMILAYLAATGQFETLILLGVWVVACLTIVFVRDYWWAPALIVNALTIETYGAGFRMTGLEVGVLIIALTFPVKLAMKTLWPARPKMDLGPFFWALTGYVVVHAIVILFYSKITGAPQIKNIVKAYYETIAPLVLYGMLIRYCDSKTVYRTTMILFGVWLFTALVGIPVILLGIQSAPLTDLKISVDFADAGGAASHFRELGPFLFIGGIAFWPVARSNRYRLLAAASVVLGFAGASLSSGRVAFFSCFLAGSFFAVARNRIWLALPVILALLVTAGVCTLKPDILFSLPEQIQRALTPFNLSDEKTEIQTELGESDRWHAELRDDSIQYWDQDTTSFWVGHGFKSWDDSIVLTDTEINVDFDQIKQFAMEMGRTENSFSSTTNIFGLTGLLLYLAFMFHTGWLLWKGRRLAPERSTARALCEFSFVNLLTYIFLLPVSGGVPQILIIYWALGILAARPYLGIPEKVAIAPAPAFDLSRQVLRDKGGALRGDPLADFAKRHARISRAGTMRQNG